MATRNLNARQPAKNIAMPKPTKKIVDEDGVVRHERLPSIPNWRKMVDLQGNVVRVVLATGFTIRGNEKNNWKDNPYGSQKWFEKIEKGFLPYDECPLAKDRIPRKKGDRVCDGTFDSEHCCPHIERVIEARRAEHTKKSEQFARAFKSNQERQTEAFEKAIKLATDGATNALTGAKRNVPQ